MGSWEEHRKYCKKLAEYYVRKYKPTKLEILELASKKRMNFRICGGADDIWRFWDSLLPHEFMDKQIEKLLLFRIDMQYSMDEIFRWVLALTFLEFDKKDGFFLQFGFDSLFWLLNLEYYKRKQRTIFQDYQLPYFDWEALDFWLEVNHEMYQSKAINEEIKTEFKNASKMLDEYCKEVMQIAVDAVAYL